MEWALAHTIFIPGAKPSGYKYKTTRPVLTDGLAGRFMKLFVVVLCYRVPDLAIDCLRSLSKEIDRVPGTRVAVCENGTGGDAAERIERAIDEQGWSSWCDLTAVYPNRGFCAGNNLVIRPV